MASRIRSELDECGYDWVTSHVFRKTVASVLDEAGLPTREISIQLAHTKTDTTERHYIAKRGTNGKRAEALETMFKKAEVV
jgi:integrase